jgi:hypothetical protein
MAASSEVDVASGHTPPDGFEKRFDWTKDISQTGLRRGMRDSLRDRASEGKNTEIGELHPAGEPDIFYFSHCCL